MIQKLTGVSAPKSVRILATLCLIGISAAIVFVLATASLRGDQAATSTLATLGTLTVGAVVALSGGKHEE